MKLFNTGIISLDSQLGGGFPSGKLILILEEPGTGGEIFTFHISMEGVRKGEKVLYVTTDYPEREVIESLRLYFGFESSDSLEILDLFTPRTTSLLDEGDVRSFIKSTRRDYLSEIKYRLNRENYERVIINNLTYFLMNYSFEEVNSFLSDLNLIAKVKDCLIIMLMTKDMFDKRVETAIKHQSGGVIELTLREVENEIQRRLKVIKLERYVVPKNILRYELTDKGISMESLMRVM
jgi:KaiC/GvpD/RAD55 family RecA-like ATPase